MSLDDAAAAAADEAAAAVAAAKAALRSRLAAARAARPAGERAADGEAIAKSALDWLTAADRPVATAAAYISGGFEPPTGPLIEALAGRGARVIVPVLLPDGDLDWAEHAPGDAIEPGLRRTVQPRGPRLGVDALRAADIVFVPALAIDRRGRRLGRGGGSYDRALSRLRLRRGDAPAEPFAVRPDREGAPVVAVLFDGELLDEVPTAGHDEQVDGALTPSRLALVPAGPTS